MRRCIMIERILIYTAKGIYTLLVIMESAQAIRKIRDIIKGGPKQ